jgi:DNA recombination protein RmuC
MEQVATAGAMALYAGWIFPAFGVALLIAIITLLAVLVKRSSQWGGAPLQNRFDTLEKGQERLEKALREEIARNREELTSALRVGREESTTALNAFAGALLKRMEGIAGLQKDQLDSFSRQLMALTRTNEQKLEQMRAAMEERLAAAQAESARQLARSRDDFAAQAKALREETGASAQRQREETALSLKSFNDSVLKGMTGLGSLLKEQMEAFSVRMQRLTESSEGKLDAVRGAVESRLKDIREDNSRQLERMRATVDEKLQGTLEKRLGESFKQVSDRLEQVHKGLGEMQTLATGVGDLKRALTNVKTRGGWGEVQLEALLEQMLSPEQYERNVRTRETGAEVVEFAIKLPGRNGGGKGEPPVWLPVDAKFPIEDYQRLVDALEQANPELAETAARGLEARIKNCAKDISTKYVNPPRTTDFGVMFLPTEGLYAEVVRRVGLVETLQRDHRVVIAGPTTFAALLNSLQMGFRTLAVQQRSSEVWELLGAVKTEFGRFGDMLAGVKKKLDQASSTMEKAEQRSRAIERKLRGVEAIPASEVEKLLPEEVSGADAGPL